jgi:predicted nucleic acid-binding protein
MIVYLDTSSLVKLYVEETGSGKIRLLVNEASLVSTSKIAYAEARAAFAKKRQEAMFSIKILRGITEDLNRDWEGYFVLEVTDGLIKAAGDIAGKYLLRGFDSIHLASAISLKDRINSEVYFSSHDTRLNQAARREGIPLL